MSKATEVIKDVIGGQIVSGTLNAIKANKPSSSKSSSSAMENTANLTQDVVGGALLGPYAKTSGSTYSTFTSVINYKS